MILSLIKLFQKDSRSKRRMRYRKRKDADEYEN
jgi:hypothetical protein